MCRVAGRFSCFRSSPLTPARAPLYISSFQKRNPVRVPNKHGISNRVGVHVHDCLIHDAALHFCTTVALERPTQKSYFRKTCTPGIVFPGLQRDQVRAQKGAPCKALGLPAPPPPHHHPTQTAASAPLLSGPGQRRSRRPSSGRAPLSPRPAAPARRRRPSYPPSGRSPRAAAASSPPAPG